MTRQRIAQLRNNALGLCAFCNDPLHPDSRAVCYYHLIKNRTRQRKKLGFKPGHKTGKGRPAITRIPQPKSDLAQAA